MHDKFSDRKHFSSAFAEVELNMPITSTTYTLILNPQSRDNCNCLSLLALFFMSLLSLCLTLPALSATAPIMYIETLWVPDPASPMQQEVHPIVQERTRQMFEENICPEQFPCQVRCQVFSESKSQWPKIFHFITWLYQHDPLSQLTIGNQFPLITQRFLHLGIRNCSKSEFECCLSISWLCGNPISSHLWAKRWGILGIERVRYWIFLWTMFWTKLSLIAQGMEVHKLIQRLTFRNRCVLRKCNPQSNWIGDFLHWLNNGVQMLVINNGFMSDH